MRRTTIFIALLAILASCAAPPVETPRRDVSTATAPASPVPVPTATSAPTPTLPAPTASPSPTPIAQYGPDNFPTDVNPFTGLKVADVSLLERRPIAVKIPEFPRRVRPQSGLSLADLVFEHYAEAGVTRFTAIFLGSDSPKVGTIRSARLIDLVITEGYRAMLVTSGTSAGTLEKFRATDFFNQVIAEAVGFEKCPPLCRVGDYHELDLLFSSTQDLWKTITDLGLNGRQDLRGMAFAADPPVGGQPGTTIHLDFHEDDTTEWRYAAATGRYARWVDTATPGELAPHTDAVNDQQITAANVVVLYANHQPTDIVEDLHSGGYCGYEIQLWNTGPAKLFRDGLAYDLTWMRTQREDLIRLVGADGIVFPFKPGNTWFEVINLGSPNTLANGVFTARFKGLPQTLYCPLPPTATPTPTATVTP